MTREENVAREVEFRINGTAYKHCIFCGYVDEDNKIMSYAGQFVESLGQRCLVVMMTDGIFYSPCRLLGTQGSYKHSFFLSEIPATQLDYPHPHSTPHPEDRQRPVL